MQLQIRLAIDLQLNKNDSSVNAINTIPPKMNNDNTNAIIIERTKPFPFGDNTYNLLNPLKT